MENEISHLRKILFILTLIFLHTNCDLLCQDIPQSQSNVGKINGYFGTGTLNLINIGFDYNIFKQFSAGIKYNYFPSSGNNAVFNSGIGCKCTYQFKEDILSQSFFTFNRVITEICSGIGKNDNPLLLQAGIGKEKRKSFFWNLGIGIVTQTSHKTWVIPYLKIGFYI